MAAQLSLGLSSGLFPEKLRLRDWALCRAHGIAELELGYEHSLPALEDEARARELEALVGNVSITSLHAAYRPGRDMSVLDEDDRAAAVRRTTEALTLARKLGARQVVVHASQEPMGPGERGARLEAARRSLIALQDAARRASLRLLVETMPPAWIPADLDEAFALVEGLDESTVGFCLDTNHSNLQGDLGEIVRALGQRLWSVHLSDNDGVDQRHWLPMAGGIDWRAFLSALDEVSYAGPLFYELDPHPDGPERGLAEIEANFGRLLALR